jgi:hypothetical protein
MLRPRSRHRLLALSFAPLALVAALGACDPPFSYPGATSDAAAIPDVALPDVVLPDGYLLTELSLDGTTTAVNPAVACTESTEDDAAVADAAADSASAIDASIDARACDAVRREGDLIFDEVMITTEPGSADRGQWLEVRSTLSCTVNLLGLHASAPHGQSFRTMDVTTDIWLAPGGLFVIADTTDASANGALPGLVLAWTGDPADALHKTSDVVTLSFGDVTLDTLTYPSKKRVEGVSFAFPSNCDPFLRADFANWRPSVYSWTAGLFGTPGSSNTDVMCNAPPVLYCGAARKPPRRARLP